MPHLTLIATIGAGTAPTGVAVNNDSNLIYVANGDSLDIIDGKTLQIAAHIPTMTGLGSYRVALNPKTNLIYVANFNSASVTVIDSANNIVKMIEVGKSPIEIAVNPVTNKIYVVNSDDNSVRVIDGGNIPGSVGINTVTFATN